MCGTHLGQVDLLTEAIAANSQVVADPRLDLALRVTVFLPSSQALVISGTQQDQWANCEVYGSESSPQLYGCVAPRHSCLQPWRCLRFATLVAKFNTEFNPENIVRPRKRGIEAGGDEPDVKRNRLNFDLDCGFENKSELLKTGESHRLEDSRYSMVWKSPPEAGLYLCADRPLTLYPTDELFGFGRGRCSLKASSLSAPPLNVVF